MKKKFLPEYEQATLRRTARRTYIEFRQTDPATGKLRRFRPTFNLNRKKFQENEKMLLSTASRLIVQINASLPFGYPFGHVGLLSPQLIAQMVFPKAKNKTSERGKRNPEMKLVKAVQYACRKKCQKASDNTIRTYGSVRNNFVNWLNTKGWENMGVTTFKKKQAREYSDYLLFEKRTRSGVGVSNRTYNNNIEFLRYMFTVIVEEKWVKKNVFSHKNFKNKTVDGVIHEVLSPEDAKVIFAYLYEHELLVFYAILIQFIGFARPSEIYGRLKRCHFDLQKGLIEVPGKEKSKTSKTKFLTIPEGFLHYFQTDFLAEIPPHYFIWGKGLLPHPTQTCGKSSVYRKYQDVVLRLHQAGKIKNCSTKLYDWKRRGITDFIPVVGIRAAQRQAAHKNLESTIVYDHPGRVNEKIRAVPDLMAPTNPASPR